MISFMIYKKRKKINKKINLIKYIKNSQKIYK